MATNCRSCGSEHLELVIDLGLQPASNALKEKAADKETWYPLRAMICKECFLVQTEIDVPPREMFNKDYVYFSGQSKQWVQHCEDYAKKTIRRFGLNKESCVVEVGGNDGTSLLPFKPHVAAVWNIEPSRSVATASEAVGVPVFNYFFGEPYLQPVQADLLIANNVMAHTPNLNGFVRAIWSALKPGGTATIEFPHLEQLIKGCQFDTIYHEHYSYFSLRALVPLFEKHQLRIYDVDILPTHGGSLRIYVHRSDVACPRPTEAVADILRSEQHLSDMGTYRAFALHAEWCRGAFRKWISTKPDVVGYGAAAKGNTFLNYCGVTDKEIPRVGDTTPAKQGMYLPGSCIKVIPESILFDRKPEYLLILAWNWKDEIIRRLKVEHPGQKFVTAIPTLEFDNG
jgi:SAM-dependent methyltransferase